MPSFCYLLQSDEGNRTYIGATTNFQRRLRQHNGELAGGARATRGQHWSLQRLYGGFATWNSALSFEWHWKRRCRGLRARLERGRELQLRHGCTVLV